MAWFRACKKVTAFLFTIGFISGGTLSGLLVNEWFDRVYLPARLHNLTPYTLSMNYYSGTSHAFGTHETRTIRRKNKRIKMVTSDKPTVDTTEPEKTTQHRLIQTHATAKQRNSARKGKRLLQSKPKPKCDYIDINTFKDCYDVHNDKKSLHNSSKQCKKNGMQLADMGSQEELNLVTKFLKKQYNIDNGQFIEKARKARKLDPVEGFVEKTWLSLFGSKTQEERAHDYNQKGWLIGGIEKTWTKAFGEYYVPSQAYWIFNVLNASDGTPTTHLERMQRKENECMSISGEGYKKTDCQHKLPSLCEYNK